MKIPFIILFVSIIFSFSRWSKADPTIVTYLQQPPFQIIKSIDKEEALNKINNFTQKTPGQTSRKILKANLGNEITHNVSGFLAVYSGYIDYSNKDGLISFPLRHTPATKTYLLITKEIILNAVKGNTFAYATTTTTINNNNAKLYSFEKKKDKNEIYYWEAKKIDLPEDGRINPLTITLITKPKNTFIEEGDFKSEESGNLILPNNIYIVGNKTNTKILLKSLEISRHLEPIDYEEKKVTETVTQKIIINR